MHTRSQLLLISAKNKLLSETGGKAVVSLNLYFAGMSRRRHMQHVTCEFSIFCLSNHIIF